MGNGKEVGAASAGSSSAKPILASIESSPSGQTERVISCALSLEQGRKGCRLCTGGLEIVLFVMIQQGIDSLPCSIPGLGCRIHAEFCLLTCPS